MDKEIWKDINGYEGLYKVSSFGNIKSLSRTFSFGNRGSKRLIPDKIIKPNIIGHKYLQIGLSKNGKRKMFYLSRIVANAFLPNPENKPEVNHIKGKHQNEYWNLEWVTKLENMSDASKRGLMVHTGLKGEKSSSSKLTEQHVTKIRNLYKTGKFEQKKIKNLFGVSATTVCQIVNRQTWTHI